MTLATASPVGSVPQRVAPPPALARALLAGCLLAAALMLPQGWSVWSRGTFLDPDDAMRTVEVRDFLDGQGWFDLAPHRLSPDHPFVMHWSRIVDAPLALMDILFGLVLTPESAERAMRIVAPAGLFGATLLVMLRLVRRLAGWRAMLPAACLLATSFELVTNFLPGHVHHHGVQAMLLIAATAALLASFGPQGRAAMAGWAAVLATISLGIGLQNLPFVAGLVLVAMGLWIVGGRAAGLALFGLGLGTALPVFLLDVPPSRWGEAACDAFSTAQLAGCAGMGLVCLVLAALSRRLSRRRHRLVAALAGSALVASSLALGFPACLRDPMAGVDPLLRAEWLSGVGEALPLLHLLVLAPAEGAALALTLAGGLLATLYAGALASPERRAMWATLLLLGLIGVAGSFWQVRVAATTCALLVPGLAVLVLDVFDRVSRHPGRPALLAAVLVGLFGNGAGWSALAAPFRPRTASAATGGSAADCFEPASFAGLAALPSGIVLSTIDPGSAILAFTHHSVLAAPYHRNTDGNRVSLLGFAALPDAARVLIGEARVRYVALCRFSSETAEIVQRHPEGLAAALLAGRVPPWLKPVGGARGAYLLFTVENAPG